MGGLGVVVVKEEEGVVGFGRRAVATEEWEAMEMRGDMQGRQEGRQV